MNTPQASAEMPRYVCHKVVHALKIIQIARRDHGQLEYFDLIPENTVYAPFAATREFMTKHNPVAPGYYVQYEDGYTSWSPVEAFEKGYTPQHVYEKEKMAADIYNRAFTPNSTEPEGVARAQNASMTAAVAADKRIASLTTALRSISGAMQACIALADSELIASEPSMMGFRSRWPGQRVEVPAPLRSCAKWFMPPRGEPKVQCTLGAGHDGICDASDRILVLKAAWNDMKEQLKRVEADGVALQSAQPPANTVMAKENALDAALTVLHEECGWPHPKEFGPSLCSVIRERVERMHNYSYLNLTIVKEMEYWRNLGLAATALAAAIDLDLTRHGV